MSRGWGGLAKIRGKKRWNTNKDIWYNLMATEILLDSLHQKYRNKDQELEKKLSRALGFVRSCLAQLGHQQKTLKRWIKPAPNQL